MNNRRRIFLVSVATAHVAFLSLGTATTATPMTPETSASALRDWLADRGLKLDALTAPQLVSETLNFYRDRRCEGLAQDSSADMLLYQWGVYDWGKGENFEFDITRQFIKRGKRGDDAISQLRITAYFPPDSQLRGIKPGNRWCEGISEVERLRDFIEGSHAYKAIAQARPKNVAVAWSPV